MKDQKDGSADEIQRETARLFRKYQRAKTDELKHKLIASLSVLAIAAAQNEKPSRARELLSLVRSAGG